MAIGVLKVPEYSGHLMIKSKVRILVPRPEVVHKPAHIKMLPSMALRFKYVQPDSFSPDIEAMSVLRILHQGFRNRFGMIFLKIRLPDFFEIRIRCKTIRRDDRMVMLAILIRKKQIK